MFTKPFLRKAKKEHREHPWTTMAQAIQIEADHERKKKRK